MTKSILFLILLTLVFSLTVAIIPAKARADDYILKPDTLIPGQYIVYNKKGNRIGVLRSDSLIPDQYILKLKEGTIKRLHFEVRNEIDGK